MNTPPRSGSFIRGPLMLAALTLLIGCAPVAIRGTVIAGELSMVAVVDPDDPRLAQPGVEGATVTVRQTGRSGAVIQRKTNDEGRFRVPLQGTGALSRPMMIEIASDGYLSAVEPSMPTPTSDQRLLIVLQPLRGGAP